jgi:hypothetical protein
MSMKQTVKANPIVYDKPNVLAVLLFCRDKENNAMRALDQHQHFLVMAATLQKNRYRWFV